MDQTTMKGFLGCISKFITLCRQEGIPDWLIYQTIKIHAAGLGQKFNTAELSPHTQILSNLTTLQGSVCGDHWISLNAYLRTSHNSSNLLNSIVNIAA